ncbi:membrane protein DedA, SNARE-associated domain [Saccharopolyspora kobensis]|uniref:Membrane protein DedA, SNARE-associated domain n=1 Tax=Saccharopolyspora kobensis TaxID=146035 RepID=A0A1H6EBP2_9PSEU|nr:VTT domain-containing protein [Saccharopolyspora kobensis]SEG95162.1 membrane protein DedA, SNARE-associated domain [Saccharopolyspora kobensis]SFD59647.1 membrane protein DedA, SNARE-associated domain [Saccharopolyspora kobensis]
MSLINQIDAAIREFIAWAATLNPWFCVLAALVLLVLETSLFIGVLVPGEATLLLTVAVLGTGWAPALFAAAVLGNLLGSSGGYWLGRLLGPGLRSTWAGRKIGEHRWRTAEQVVQESGGRALITMRFVAVVHAVVPAVVGTLRMPYRRFLGLVAVAAMLWAGVQTTVAVLLGEAARAVGYGWTVIALTTVAALATGVLVFRSVRRNGARRTAPEPVESCAGRNAI